MRRPTLIASVFVLASSVLGCPTPETTDAFIPSTTDAFVPEGTDAGPITSDAGATPLAVTGSASAQIPAVATCIGTQAMPMAGAAVAGTLTVTALGLAPAPVANTAIQVFNGANVAAPASRQTARRSRPTRRATPPSPSQAEAGSRTASPPTR